MLGAELEMSQVVVSILTCYMLDEWKMSQVIVSILTFYRLSRKCTR